MVSVVSGDKSVELLSLIEEKNVNMALLVAQKINFIVSVETSLAICGLSLGPSCCLRPRGHGLLRPCKVLT